MQYDISYFKNKINQMKTIMYFTRSSKNNHGKTRKLHKLKFQKSKNLFRYVNEIQKYVTFFSNFYMLVFVILNLLEPIYSH